MNLALADCKLRTWRDDDVDSLVLQAKDRRVWRNLRDVFPHPYTLDDARRWIAFARDVTPGAQFAIDVAGRAIGGAGLFPRDDVYRRSAEIGYWLGRDYWGRGLATQVVPALVQYAFESFDVCRLSAEVFEGNAASMRVLEKSGFSLEGRLRKAITKDGRTLDAFLYALVRDDRCT